MSFKHMKMTVEPQALALPLHCSSTLCSPTGGNLVIAECSSSVFPGPSLGCSHRKKQRLGLLLLVQDHSSSSVEKSVSTNRDLETS